MKTYRLERTQFIPKKPDEVFSFFKKPENLEQLTPKSLGFKILTPSPIEMKEGAVIDYTINLLGMPVRWTTLITDYKPNESFQDVQIRGPYSYWHHTHRFKAVNGGTEMTDEVIYALPLGPIGNLAHTLFVKSNLQQIFDYRHKTISENLILKGSK